MTQKSTLSMRAAYISQFNRPYSLGERPRPALEGGDILVRVHAAGFCHSDHQAWQGQFNSPLGLVPSHEPAGVISELGPTYKGDLKIGDRVGALNFKHACGDCAGCRLTLRTSNRLDPRFCEVRETAGFQHDGVFADYIVADPATVVRLPDSVSFEQAAPLMCAGATVWGSIERTTQGLERGETVAIIGIGGLGHLGIQFAKALGFRTIAVDNRPAGCELARQVENQHLQPDLVVDSSAPEDAAKAIYDLTKGEGVAAAIVCTDSIPANKWALGLLRTGGVLGLLGLPPVPWQFDADLMVFKELSIKGSYVASRAATERMMEVVESSQVSSRLTVISYEEIPGIIQKYEETSFQGRLVVKFVE